MAFEQGFKDFNNAGDEGVDRVTGVEKALQVRYELSSAIVQRRDPPRT